MKKSNITVQNTNYDNVFILSADERRELISFIEWIETFTGKCYYCGSEESIVKISDSHNFYYACKNCMEGCQVDNDISTTS